MTSTQRNWLTVAFVAVLSLLNIGRAAALDAGDTAPDFTAQSVLGGKTVTFSLKDALAKHAVVLYFFPKAFTAG
jgi:hypothetical protein